MVHNKKRYRPVYKYRYYKLKKLYDQALLNPDQVLKSYLDEINTKMERILTEFPEFKTF